MKRDLPDGFTTPDEQLEPRPRSLLARRSFWVGGAVSLVIWGVLGVVAYLLLG